MRTFTKQSTKCNQYTLLHMHHCLYNLGFAIQYCNLTSRNVILFLIIEQSLTILKNALQKNTQSNSQLNSPTVVRNLASNLTAKLY